MLQNCILNVYSKPKFWSLRKKSRRILTNTTFIKPKKLFQLKTNLARKMFSTEVVLKEMQTAILKKERAEMKSANNSCLKLTQIATNK